MIVADTNVIVRFLVEDHPAQASKAVKLLRSGNVVLLASVVMETEWVLRSIYKLSRTEIVSVLQKLLALEKLHIPDLDIVIRAHRGYAAGMDFAGALHLASSTSSGKFATFDAGLKRQAARIGGFVPVVSP